MEEDQLWRKVAEDGDGQALAALFELHVDRIFRHAARLAADRRDAEDATATAFLELWRRRGSVRLVDGSPLPWLLVTTTNALKNLSRSTARYRRLIDALPRSTSSPSAAELAFGDLDARDLLQPLNTTDQQLVTLVILEGYSTADAATVLGLSPGTARTRLSRARTRMRSNCSKTAANREELA